MTHSQSTRQNLLLWIVVLWLSLLFATRSAAQSSRVGGRIAGTVSDISGARIPGAKVDLQEAGTNQVRSLQTNEQGLFSVPDLRIGTYEVRCTHAGFAPYLHVGVIVELGMTVPLDLVLKPASASTQVTVSAQPSIIDASQTSEAFHMDYERVEETPLRTRDYLDFTLLAPGVAASNGPHLSVAQTLLADSGFTFGGLRGRSNTLSIDGLDNNDEYAGTSRTALSVEIVSEFQVVNNGISAEYGGASGGSINVVSKSGTNAMHGDLFRFAQNGVLNAKPSLQSGSGNPDFLRYREGFALGGPIVKNRTFFSTAFEQESSHRQTGSDIDPMTASTLNTFFATGAFPGIAVRNITTGFTRTSGAETEASARLDHRLTEHNALSLRYSFRNRRDAGNSFNDSGLADASAWGSSFVADHDFAGSLVTVFSSQVISDFRFQAATRRANLRTNDVVGPEIDIAGLIQFGRPHEGNSRRRENHYQASYSLTAMRGNHLWKVGGTINRVALRATVPDGFGAAYLFGSMADFLAGKPDSFRQAFGSPSFNLAVVSYGAFVQDHWSLDRKLNLDLGARYDFEHLPARLNQDINNISPRIGLAYSPSSKWVLRAGYGIFFDRYVLAYLGRAVEKDGSNAFEQVAYGTAASSLFQRAAGGRLPLPVAGFAPSIFRADQNLATPYSQQASLGVEHLIAKNTTVSGLYLFVRGLKLSRTRNFNLLPPVTLTLKNAASLGVSNPTAQQVGTEVFGPGRADSAWMNIYQLENSTGSNYHGLSISINRQLSELSFSANYTLSKTLDDASDFDEQPQNPFATHLERAVSRNHQQHRFVLSALWELPFGKGSTDWIGKTFSGIELSPILTLGSGRPVNPLTGVDSNRSGAWPIDSRPLGFSRNSLSTSSLAVLDFRINKYLPIGERGKLELMVDSFNLFNRTNVVQINPIFGTNVGPLEGFGRAIGALNSRQTQLGLEYEF